MNAGNSVTQVAFSRKVNLELRHSYPGIEEPHIRKVYGSNSTSPSWLRACSIRQWTDIELELPR
jgi:hypothetical protein